MTTSEVKGGGQQWILQFCHGYDGPFLDCARQYAALFAGTRYKVCTVYLTGAPSAEVEVMPSAREKTIYHKDLLPVVYVFGDTATNVNEQRSRTTSGVINLYFLFIFKVMGNNFRHQK